MRVLLFVQSGSARPRVANVAVYDSYRAAFERVGDCWLSPRAVGYMKAADRWWLVECANADCGRGLIAGGRPVKYAGRWAAPRGRILVSGWGKS